MIDKYELLQEWQCLANQHFRAGNATLYFVCKANVLRLLKLYPDEIRPKLFAL